MEYYTENVGSACKTKEKLSVSLFKVAPEHA